MPAAGAAGQARVDGAKGPNAARAVTYAFLMGLIFWAVALFAVAIGTSLAFKLIGSKWDKTTLGYTAEPSVMGYTEAGMAQWASIADIKPVKGGNDIEVVVKPLLAPIFYTGQPAQANVTQSGGRITHCEVRLDPVYFMALNEASQAATVTHELGHCLGLDHSDSPSIMMNPYFYAFGADDAAGAASLYGAAKPAGQVPASEAPATPAPATPETTPSAPPVQLAAPPVATSTAEASPESRAFVAAPTATPGWYRVTWALPAASVAECGCQAVYAADTGHWQRWFRGQPGYLSSLRTLEPGTSYWMLMN